MFTPRYIECFKHYLAYFSTLALTTNSSTRLFRLRVSEETNLNFSSNVAIKTRIQGCTLPGGSLTKVSTGRESTQAEPSDSAHFDSPVYQAENATISDGVDTVHDVQVQLGRLHSRPLYMSLQRSTVDTVWVQISVAFKDALKPWLDQSWMLKGVSLVIPPPVWLLTTYSPPAIGEHICSHYR